MTRGGTGSATASLSSTSLTMFTDTGEPLVKRLRDRRVWTALVSACPRHA
jgi:hypothetical protein